ncbi:MAG: DUF4124 domain-containing protein [Gammaproteobacteria bacterium]
MKFRPLTVATLITLLVSGSAFANEIYKWTDEDGNVHFGDRPEGEAPERLTIASSPTNRTAVREQNAARADARAEARQAKEEAAAAAPTREEVEAAAAERTQRCAALRERMQKLVQSRRLYREDEAGERVYLDETETTAARADVEQQISEHCSS